MANKSGNGLTILIILIVIAILYPFISQQSFINLNPKGGFVNYVGTVHPQFDSFLSSRKISPTVSPVVKIGEQEIKTDLVTSRYSGFQCQSLPSGVSDIKETYVDEFGCQHWEFKERYSVQPYCCYRSNKIDPNTHPSRFSYPGCSPKGSSGSSWYDCGIYDYRINYDYGGKTSKDFGRGCYYRITVNGEVITGDKLNEYVIGRKYFELDGLVIEASSSFDTQGSFGSCRWVKHFITYKFDGVYIESDGEKIIINNTKGTTYLTELGNVKPGISEFTYSGNSLDFFLPRTSIQGLNSGYSCENYNHAEIPFGKCNEDYQVGTVTFDLPTTTTTTTTTLDIPVTTTTINSNGNSNHVTENIISTIPEDSLWIKIRDGLKNFFDKIFEVLGL